MFRSVLQSPMFLAVLMAWRVVGVDGGRVLDVRRDVDVDSASKPDVYTKSGPDVDVTAAPYNNSTSEGDFDITIRPDVDVSTTAYLNTITVPNLDTTTVLNLDTTTSPYLDSTTVPYLDSTRLPDVDSTSDVDINAFLDSSFNRANVTELANAVNRFSRKMYINNSNAVFSAFSAHAVLSMACMGARGNTADQMKDVLGLTKIFNHQKLYAFVIDMFGPKFIKGFDVRIARLIGMWIDPQLYVNEDFKNEANVTYDSPMIDHIDRSYPEFLFHKWFEENMSNDAQYNYESDFIQFHTPLALVGTLVFAGTWQSVFNPLFSYRGPFYKEDHSKVEVGYMNQIHTYDLKKHPLTQFSLRIPFKNERFAFYVVVFNDNRPRTDSEEFLFQQDFYQDEFLFEGFQKTLIDLTFPKFNIATSHKLKEALIKMGMTDAFTPAANFSGITPIHVHIDQVFQMVVIGLQENGTTISPQGTPNSPQDYIKSENDIKHHVIKVDRPFLFFIRDDKLKIILLQGKISDPTVTKTE